jgi:hypothetical protein
MTFLDKAIGYGEGIKEALNYAVLASLRRVAVAPHYNLLDSQ